MEKGDKRIERERFKLGQREYGEKDEIFFEGTYLPTHCCLSFRYFSIHFGLVSSL